MRFFFTLIALVAFGIASTFTVKNVLAEWFVSTGSESVIVRPSSNEKGGKTIQKEISSSRKKKPSPTPTLAPQTSVSPTITPTAVPVAAGRNYFVGTSGSDSNSGTEEGKAFSTIQKAIDVAEPGENIKLLSGTYLQDFVSKKNGRQDAPITITGDPSAIVKGAGAGRVIEINHDFITLSGFTVDGLYGSDGSVGGYRAKLIYVLGKESKTGVTGLKILNMTIKNAKGECVRLRYFAQSNEIANNTIQNCGVEDFRFGGGGKNGEAIYIGTAPEQLGDGKNPTADSDQSNNNLIHGNNFDTQGNECVDIKEGSSGNITENNKCTGQKDPESGGFDSRGNGNIFRNNEIFGNLGAGVRLGGDSESDGTGNDIYSNVIKDNASGGIKMQRSPQGKICGNTMSGNSSNTTGSYASKYDPASSCSN